MIAFWSARLAQELSCSTVLMFFCISLWACFNSLDIFWFGGFMMLQLSFDICSPNFWLVKVSPPLPGCWETQSIKAVKAIPLILDFRCLLNPIPFQSMLLGIFSPPVSGFLQFAAILQIDLANMRGPSWLLAPSCSLCGSVFQTLTVTLRFVLRRTGHSTLNS